MLNDLDEEFDSLASLQREIDQGSPRPLLPENGCLPLEDIHSLPDVFQPRRGVDTDGVADKLFVEDLRNTLETRLRVGLDPISVFWTGKRWVLVDGHHRLKAYRSSRLWNDRPVPVRVIEGDLWAAIRESVEENSKSRLQLTRSEQSDFAWQFVCKTDPSETVFMEVTGQRRRQYFKMKKRIRELLEAHPELSRLDLAEKSWGLISIKDPFAELEASMDPEIAENIKAIEWAKIMRKKLGPKLTRQPEILAKAILEVNPKLPALLMESFAWSGIRDELLDDWCRDRADPDF